MKLREASLWKLTKTPHQYIWKAFHKCALRPFAFSNNRV
jgi:hypothetical protein